MFEGEGRTFVGAASPSVGRRREGAAKGSKVEMGGGIHGIARPDFVPVLIEDDPFAVADAARSRENFVIAVRAVQREVRVGRGLVVAAR